MTTQRQERNFLSGLLEMLARGGDRFSAPTGVLPPQPPPHALSPEGLERQRLQEYFYEAESTPEEEEELRLAAQRRQHPFLMAEQERLSPAQTAQVNAARAYLESEGIETTSQFPSEQWLTESGLVEPRATEEPPPERYRYRTRAENIGNALDFIGLHRSLNPFPVPEEEVKGPDLRPKGPISDAIGAGRDFLGEVSEFIAPKDMFEPPFTVEQVLGSMQGVYEGLGEIAVQQLPFKGERWGDLEPRGTRIDPSNPPVLRADQLLLPMEPTERIPDPERQLMDWELEQRRGPDTLPLPHIERDFFPGGRDINRRIFGPGGIWDFNPSPEPGQPWITSPLREAGQRALPQPPGLRGAVDLLTELYTTGPIPYYGFTSLKGPASRGFARVPGTGPMGEWGVDLLNPATGYGLGELPTPFLGMRRLDLGTGPAPSAASGRYGQPLLGFTGPMSRTYLAGPEDLEGQQLAEMLRPEGKLGLATPEARRELERRVFHEVSPQGRRDLLGEERKDRQLGISPRMGELPLERGLGQEPMYETRGLERLGRLREGQQPIRRQMPHGDRYTPAEPEKWYGTDELGNQTYEIEEVREFITRPDGTRVNARTGLRASFIDEIMLRRAERALQAPEGNTDLGIYLRNAMAYRELGPAGRQSLDTLWFNIEQNPTHANESSVLIIGDIYTTEPRLQDWIAASEFEIRKLLEVGMESSQVRGIIQRHVHVEGMAPEEIAEIEKFIDNLMYRSENPIKSHAEYTTDEILALGGYEPGVEKDKLIIGAHVAPTGTEGGGRAILDAHTQFKRYEMPELVQRQKAASMELHDVVSTSLADLENAVRNPYNYQEGEIRRLETASGVTLTRQPPFGEISVEPSITSIQNRREAIMRFRSEDEASFDLRLAEAERIDGEQRQIAMELGEAQVLALARRGTQRVPPIDPAKATIRSLEDLQDHYDTVYRSGPGTPDWDDLSYNRKKEYRDEMLIIATDLIKELDKLGPNWNSDDLPQEVIKARADILGMFDDVVRRWRQVNEDWIRAKDKRQGMVGGKNNPVTRGESMRSMQSRPRESYGPSTSQVEERINMLLGRYDRAAGPSIDEAGGWWARRGVPLTEEQSAEAAEAALDPAIAKLMRERERQWQESAREGDPDYVDMRTEHVKYEEQRSDLAKIEETPEERLGLLKTGMPAKLKTYQATEQSTLANKTGYMRDEEARRDPRYDRGYSNELEYDGAGPMGQIREVTIVQNPLVITSDDQWRQVLIDAGVEPSVTGFGLKEFGQLSDVQLAQGWETIDDLNKARAEQLRDYLERQLGYDSVIINIPTDRNPMNLLNRPTLGSMAEDVGSRILRRDFGGARVLEFRPWDPEWRLKLDRGDAPPFVPRTTQPETPARTPQPEDLPSLSRPREREIEGDTWQEKADNLPNVVKRILARSGHGGRAQLSRAEQEELRDFLLEHGKVHPDNGTITEEYGGRLSFYMGYFEIGSPGGMQEGYVVWNPGTGGGPNEFGIHMTAPDPRAISRTRNKVQSKAYGEPTDEARETLEIFDIRVWTDETPTGDPALVGREAEDVTVLETTQRPISQVDEPADIVVEDDGTIVVNNVEAVEAEARGDVREGYEQVEGGSIVEGEEISQADVPTDARVIEIDEKIAILNRESYGPARTRLRELIDSGSKTREVLDEIERLRVQQKEAFEENQRLMDQREAIINGDADRLADVGDKYMQVDEDNNIVLSDIPNDVQWLEDAPPGQRSTIKDIDRARIINEARDQEAKNTGWEGYLAKERIIRLRAGLDMPLGMTDEEKTFVLRDATSVSFRMTDLLAKYDRQLDNLYSIQAQRQMEGLDFTSSDDLAIELANEVVTHATHVKRNADSIREDPGRNHLYIASTRKRAELVDKLDSGELTLDEFRNQMRDVDADEFQVGKDYILKKNTPGVPPPGGKGPHGSAGPGGIWDDENQTTSLIARARAHMLRGESEAEALLRIHESVINNQQRQATIHVQNGIKKFQALGIGKVVKGQLVLRGGTDDLARMDALFEALHNQSAIEAGTKVRGLILPGEMVLEPALREIYEDLRWLTDWEQDARIAFDTNVALVDEYFYRGWKPPKGIEARWTEEGMELVFTPAFKRPRRNASYREMRDLGWEPLHWNPYEQWKSSRMQGVRYRQQMQLVEAMRESKIAKIRKRDGNNVGTRVPLVGPAFEGKVYRDAQGSIGHTLGWEVDHRTADILESMYGRRVRPKPVLRGREIHGVSLETDVMKIIDWLVFIPKQAKLFLSLFQHMDFMNRVGHAAWSRLLTDMEDMLYIDKNKPFFSWKSPMRFQTEANTRDAWVKLGQSAAGATYKLPWNMGKMLGKGYRRDWRIAIKEAYDSTAPLVPGREGVHMYNISRAGLSYTDPTIFKADMDVIARDVFNESGLSKSIKFPFRMVRDLDFNMRQGLFEGAYPMAQLIDIQNYMAQSMAKLYPHATDAQLNSMIATQANLAYSTLPASQSVIKSRFMRAFLVRTMFSMSESEALLRQGLAIFNFGENKNVGKYWRRRAIGAYMYMSLIATIINMVSTSDIKDGGVHIGDPLPLDRYWKLFENNPYNKWIPMNPIGNSYSADFLSPNLWRTKNGNQVTLDLMGQMDTVFRILDPVQFALSRESVPVRALSEQIVSKDFYDQRIDQVGMSIGPVDGILSRTVALARTMGAPIGLGTAGIDILHANVPQLQDEESWAYGLVQPGELRLDTAGHLVQATGLNVRSQNFYKMTNELSASMFKKEYKDLEPILQDMIKAQPEVIALGTRDNTSTHLNLEARDEYGQSLMTLAKDPKNKNKSFNRATQAAHYAGVKKGLMMAKGEEWDNTKKLNSPDDSIRAIAEYYSIFQDPLYLAETTGEAQEIVRTRLEAKFGWTKEQQEAVNRHRLSRLPVPKALLPELGAWGVDWSRSLESNIAYAIRQGATEEQMANYRAIMLMEKEAIADPIKDRPLQWFEPGGSTEAQREAGRPYIGLEGADAPPPIAPPMNPEDWIRPYYPPRRSPARPQYPSPLDDWQLWQHGQRQPALR